MIVSCEQQSMVEKREQTSFFVGLNLSLDIQTYTARVRMYVLAAEMGISQIYERTSILNE